MALIGTRRCFAIMSIVGLASIVSLESARLRLEKQAKAWPLPVEHDVGDTLQVKHNRTIHALDDGNHGLGSSTANLTSWLGEAHDDEECLPIAKWQLKKYSPYSCNMLHELDIDPATSGLSLINCGGDRCAFRVRDSQGQETAFKTVRISEYLDYPDSAWKDTIVMERLSSSPFVVNIYGTFLRH